MTNTKNNTFSFERNGISAEVNAKCFEDTSVPILLQIDDASRYSIDVQSVFIGSINIYDFIKGSDIEEKIITKGEELCFGLFHDL